MVLLYRFPAPGRFFYEDARKKTGQQLPINESKIRQQTGNEPEIFP